MLQDKSRESKSLAQAFESVDQFGFVDIHDALTTGKIPAAAPPSESAFHAVGGTPLSPSQIGGKPSDVFEAYEMRDKARAALSDAQAKPDAATSGNGSAAE